jgi:hypothetical protein
VREINPAAKRLFINQSRLRIVLVLCVPLLYPLISYRENLRNPVLVSAGISAVLGATLFILLQRKKVGARRLMNVADILWNVWGFVGISLLFSSADTFAGLDLKNAIKMLEQFPLIYSLVATGLLSTACARIAVALNALFPR